MPTLIIPDKERKTERIETVADMPPTPIGPLRLLPLQQVVDQYLVASGFLDIPTGERVREIMESFPKAEGNGDTDHPSISITITTKEHRLLLPLG